MGLDEDTTNRNRLSVSIIEVRWRYAITLTGVLYLRCSK